MRQGLLWLTAVVVGVAGCGNPGAATQPTRFAVTTVVPSATGIPIYVTTAGDYEFIAVQSTGQIFTYHVGSGSQVLAAPPYTTPCLDPSGMVVTTVAGVQVMAVVCYDTGSLLTLQVHSDGSLSALGQVAGLTQPYPQIALDGTNVLIPLFGSNGGNGGVAKVSIAVPAVPLITGTAVLASPATGGVTNTGYVAAAAGYIYVSGGSESFPTDMSSTIQVFNETTMTLVGTPLLVAHSPQQIAVQGTVAFAAFYDAQQLESIDISNPASPHVLQILSLASATGGCHAIPIVLEPTSAYVGCAEGMIESFNISNPAAITLTASRANIFAPQRMALAQSYLLIVSGVAGGSVYEVGPGPPF